MKKLFILSILLLTGCSLGGEKLHFYGESDIWQVDYEATNIEDEEVVPQFAIKYTEEKPAPTKMRYAINGERFNHSGEARADKGIKKVNRDGSNCSKCIHFQENENIVATIRWQGEKEEVRLKSEK
jgi:hypothetical protein